MPDERAPTDELSLEGIGGLYNGEVFVLRTGQAGTVGASSLATFPVTLCRNYRRLAEATPLDAVLERLAPEHVRFLYLGGGRLIVEDLAGRDVRVGWRDFEEKIELDLTEGRAEIEFGYGERIVASFPDSPDRMLEASPPPGPEDVAERVFMSLLGEWEAEEEQLRLVDPERDTGPIPEPDPAAMPAKKRRRRRGLLDLFRRSPAVLLSALFHLVVVLGLFTWVSLSRPPDRSRAG